MSIKTAEEAARMAENSAEVSARAADAAARKTAEASAKAARATEETVSKAADAGVKAVKAVGKEIASFGKWVASGISSLFAALGSGGTAVLVIVLICIVGAVLVGCFGWLLPGGNSAETMALIELLETTDDDFDAKIVKIQSSSTYDKVEISDDRASWQEVLSVFAAMEMGQNEEKPEEPVEPPRQKSREEILLQIVYDMTHIDHKVVKEKVTEQVPAVNSSGQAVLIPQAKEQQVLYINLTHFTPEEMAGVYRFDGEQRKQMYAMLSVDGDAWTYMLDEAFAKEKREVK